MVRIGVLLFLLVLVSDQVTKEMATSYLVLGQPVEIIPDLFNFTLVLNPGAAFGLFSGMPNETRRLVLGIVSILALLVVFRFMTKEAKGDAISQAALTGVLAGAVGNIIDRFRYDAVVDFLDVYVGQNHWPAFNIADSAISVGVTILIVRLLFRPPESVEEESSGD